MPHDEQDFTTETWINAFEDNPYLSEDYNKKVSNRFSKVQKAYKFTHCLENYIFLNGDDSEIEQILNMVQYRSNSDWGIPWNTAHDEHANYFYATLYKVHLDNFIKAYKWLKLCPLDMVFALSKGDKGSQNVSEMSVETKVLDNSDKSKIKIEKSANSVQRSKNEVFRLLREILTYKIHNQNWEAKSYYTDLKKITGYRSPQKSFQISTPFDKLDYSKRKDLKPKFIQFYDLFIINNNDHQPITSTLTDLQKAIIIQKLYKEGFFISSSNDDTKESVTQLFNISDKDVLEKYTNNPVTPSSSDATILSNYFKDLKQKIESFLFIDNILDYLLEEQYDVLPKHDSIICKQSEIDAVEAEMILILDYYLGENTYKLSKKIYNEQITLEEIRTDDNFINEELTDDTDCSDDLLKDYEMDLISLCCNTLSNSCLFDA